MVRHHKIIFEENLNHLIPINKTVKNETAEGKIKFLRATRLASISENCQKSLLNSTNKIKKTCIVKTKIADTKYLILDLFKTNDSTPKDANPTMEKIISKITRDGCTDEKKGIFST